jgi:hypothetical protein
VLLEDAVLATAEDVDGDHGGGIRVVAGRELRTSNWWAIVLPGICSIPVIAIPESVVSGMVGSCRKLPGRAVPKPGLINLKSRRALTRSTGSNAAAPARPDGQ